MAEDRGQWGRQLEFVLTMIGYAVGLGNVWRFPYLCFNNGGGAFLIPYVICLVTLGIPMFALECAFGQYGRKGPLSIWSINPTFKGLGITMVVSCFFVFIYYNVIIAWALRYLVASFTSDLPWIDCADCSCVLYNKKNLTEEDVEVLRFNNSLGLFCPNLTVDGPTASPSENFFYKDILKDSGYIGTTGDVQWELLVSNAVAFLIIFLVLVKGIQSLGKVVYVTATFPYILLTIILVKSALLDGAYDGVIYYLTPDFEKLTHAKVWSDAAVQIFFSLSACMGGLIALSSYNKFNNNIVRDAFTIPIINCLTSFYAGFVVFCTLGHMAHVKDVSIKNVTAEGPGLVFVVYPEALAEMPVSPLWAILFFIMLAMLGFSTQFSAGETIMTSIIDEFPYVMRSRKRQILFRFTVCLLAFLLGIPMVTQGGSHLLTLVDEAVLGFPLLLIGLLEYFVIIHLYGYSRFSADMKTMIGFSPFIYFRITWVVVSPILLLAVIVFKAYQSEDIDPPWSGLLYYLIVLGCMVWVPVYFFYYACKHGLWEIMQPKLDWINKRKLGRRMHDDTADRERDGLSFISDNRAGFAEFTLLVEDASSSSSNRIIDAYDNKGFMMEERQSDIIREMEMRRINGPEKTTAF